MRKLQLLGGTGFIGINLTNHLKSNGYCCFNTPKSSFATSQNYIKEGVDVVINLLGRAHDLKSEINKDEYYKINTEYAINSFLHFLGSDAKVFIFISSVKAVRENTNEVLEEDIDPNPQTHYGKSKLLAEKFIVSQKIPEGKRVYILRPTMIHGPGNKGNLNLLFQLVNKGVPIPLGAFQNQRSFCSIANVCFVVQQLVEGEGIPSGVYNIADDEPISTIDLIGLIAQSQNRTSKVWNLSKKFIEGVASIGDMLHLPLNSERLNKLTTSYIVSNAKIKAAIGKPLPVSSREGLLMTFKSFNSK